MPSKELVVTEAGDIPTKLVDGKPTYVYWNILGLAQSARLALIAANVDYVDVRIDADVSQEGWLAAKHTEEMEKVLSFPNLPYFLHPDLGDRGLVQSDSILRFIGAKYGMLGSSPALTDMYLEHLHDAETTIAALSYGKTPDKVLAWYKSSVPDYLKPFGKLLASHKYLSESEGPSIADFKLYVFLYKLTVIQDQLGDEMTKSIIGEDAEWIKTYMGLIEGIPSIKAYSASPSYMKGPLNNPSAKWRG
uniref:glutathione transferase n=1 Tax=Amphora coffeiformis TaxID=265554 RepID=A0A7S3L7P0_9STRA|eukprot:scaffold10861_cov180-Amphora_coffeaeformis.AAC.34